MLDLGVNCVVRRMFMWWDLMAVCRLGSAREVEETRD